MDIQLKKKTDNKVKTSITLDKAVLEAIKGLDSDLNVSDLINKLLKNFLDNVNK